MSQDKPDREIRIDDHEDINVDVTFKNFILDYCAHLPLVVASYLPNASQRPEWIETWQRMGLEGSTDDRRNLYQAMRRSNALLESLTSSLIAGHAEAQTHLEVKLEMDQAEAKVRAFLTSLGMEEFAENAEAIMPNTFVYRKLSPIDWNHRFHQQLQECGETEMAERFRQDPDDFWEQVSDDRAVHQSDSVEGGESGIPGEWHDFGQQLLGCMPSVETNVESAQCAFRHHTEGDITHLRMLPMPCELVGGPHDGREVVPALEVDILGIESLFDDVEEETWVTQDDDPNGPFIKFVGTVDGRNVELKVQSGPPRWSLS